MSDCVSCCEKEREITRLTTEIELLQSELDEITNDSAFDAFAGMKEKIQSDISARKNVLESGKLLCESMRDTCGHCCVQQWTSGQQNIISTLSDAHREIIEYYKGQILAKNTNMDALFTLIASYPNEIKEIVIAYLRT